MLAFIGAVVVSWWFIIILFCGALWTTHNDSEGWAVFWLLALSVVLYLFFQIPTKTLLMGLGAYIPIGLVWSIQRWKRYCRKYIEHAKKYPSSYDRTTAESALNAKSNINRILTWVFIWPISLIDNIIGDLIDAVREFIQKYLIKVYENISGKYIDQLPEKKQPHRSRN